MFRLLVVLYAGAALAQGPNAEEKKQLEDSVAEAGLNDAAIAKLSGEQIHDILRHGKKQEPPAVAVIAVIGFFSTTIFGLAAVLFAVHRIYRQRAETLRLMVEKGVAIPPELISPPPRPASDLRRGLVLLMFGLGLSICLLATSEVRGMWTLGLVPLLVGAGYLIVFRVTRAAGGSAPSQPVAT